MFLKSQAEWFRYSHHMAPLPASIPVAMSVERSKLPTQSTLVFPIEPTSGLNRSHASSARASISPVVVNGRRAGLEHRHKTLSNEVSVPLEPAVTPASSMRPPQDAYMHPNAPRGLASYQVPDLPYDRQNQASRAASSLPSSGYLDYMPPPSVPPHAYFANTFTPSRAHNGQTAQSLPISGSEPKLAPQNAVPHSGHQQSQIPLSGPSDSPGTSLTNVSNARRVAQHLSDRYAARIAAPTPVRVPIHNQGSLLAAAWTPPSLPGSSPGPPNSDLVYPEETTHNGSERADEDRTLFNASDPDVVDARRTSTDLSSSHFRPRPLTPDTMFALMDPILMSWSS
ncbi:hypothetical protein PC9H_006189 [Pleurotus ostreatus]|uniref:Uncharacterized protein n=1 Tax=Pleurotus ostreatus TaxID=5322 RepID=A0A8H7A0G6_PLEOS|nr:uncharacterized protein PC9H_006189 [Pleurotus ostreatus]KAF7430481.1 hypothetical protein PC9H_006189 [Pleurotus ostreatus]